MNFVCIVFEIGDKMLTLSSMENLIVQCNLQGSTNDAIGNTIGAFGTDRWLSIMQTVYNLGKITNVGKSHDSIWRFKL